MIQKKKNSLCKKPEEQEVMQNKEHEIVMKPLLEKPKSSLITKEPKEEEDSEKSKEE